MSKTITYTPKEACLVPECQRESKFRGLCMQHYQTCLRMIYLKRTTWEKLEKAGKVKPKHVKAATNWFTT